VDDPVVADRIAQAYIDLQVIRFYALRSLSNPTPGVEASVAKLLWAGWHKRLGELALSVRGAAATEAEDGELDALQRLFLFSRSDTIYGGSDEIQRDIIARRALGLPRV
jgi:alkylation response protein AidB-like acyl-CoA dehydrogenase